MQEDAKDIQEGTFKMEPEQSQLKNIMSIQNVTSQFIHIQKKHNISSQSKQMQHKNKNSSNGSTIKNKMQNKMQNKKQHQKNSQKNNQNQRTRKKMIDKCFLDRVNHQQIKCRFLQFIKNQMETQYQRLGDSSTDNIDESKPKEVKLDNYIICPDVLLGTGSFSSVYLCKKDDNSRAAVKVLSKNTKKSEHIIKVAKAEVRIIRKLKHQNIVGYLGSYQSQNNYYILFQYCQGKTLKQILINCKKMEIKNVINVAFGIITGLSYLHQRKIMHRDIKPDNIKFFKGKPTLIDFGFACQLPNGEKTILHESVGTPSYMSPEMLQHKSYTYKSDIWSLGVVLYELLFGKLPWSGRTQTQLCNNILNNNLLIPSSPQIGETLQKIIIGCLQKKVTDRISMNNLIQLKNNLPTFQIELNQQKKQNACNIFCWFT